MIKTSSCARGKRRGAGNGKVLLALIGALLLAVLMSACSEASGGDAGAAPSDTAGKATTSTAASGIEVKIETKTEPIPYESEYEEDASINLGEYEVRQEGQEGTKELTYRVTYTNGIETARELISEVVLTEPVTYIEAVGTHVTHHEDPTATTSTSTTATNQQPDAAGSSCPAGVVAICADGSVSMGSTNPAIPLCAGRGGVARTCP
jgi:hypothetical protein